MVLHTLSDFETVHQYILRGSEGISIVFRERVLPSLGKIKAPAPGRGSEAIVFREKVLSCLRKIKAPASGRGSEAIVFGEMVLSSLGN